MKISVSSFLFLVLVSAVIGCGSNEPVRSTDGADAQAIADYEAAVAAAEQQDVDADMEAEAGGDE